MATNPLPLDDDEQPRRRALIIKFPTAGDELARPVDDSFPEFHQPLRWYNDAE